MARSFVDLTTQTLGEHFLPVWFLGSLLNIRPGAAPSVMSYLMERDASRRGNIPLPTPSQPTSSASASSDKSSVNTLPLAANNVTNDVTPGQPGLHPSNDVQPFEMDQVPHPSNDVQGFGMDPPVGVPEHFQPRYSTELK